jgi:hypothetical protein
VQAGGKREVDVGAQAQHEAQHRGERLRGALDARRVEATALGLAHRPTDDGREDQPGRPDDEERRSPADQLTEVTAEEDPREHAHAAARARDAEDAAPALGREVVRNERVGRWRATRLADADEDARERQLPEAMGQAGRGRSQAPQSDRHRGDAAARAAVGQARDGDADRGVEDREREAEQKAQLRIRQAEIPLDVVTQHREDQSVHDAEQLDQEQDGD